MQFTGDPYREYNTTKEGMMSRRTIALMLIFGLWVASASAGIYYEAVTTTEGKNQSDMGNMKLKAWVESENAKVEFYQSKNPT